MRDMRCKMQVRSEERRSGSERGRRAGQGRTDGAGRDKAKMRSRQEEQTILEYVEVSGG